MLGETVLDAATLNELLGKTYNAQGAEIGCALGDPVERLYPAAGLPVGRSGTEDLTLRHETAL